MDKIYCLFEARHQLPSNEGALCQDFDWSSLSTLRTNFWYEATALLAEGQTIRVIVTGLTPALTEFISDCRCKKGQLILLHYDREADCYREQII